MGHMDCSVGGLPKPVWSCVPVVVLILIKRCETALQHWPRPDRPHLSRSKWTSSTFAILGIAIGSRWWFSATVCLRDTWAQTGSGANRSMRDSHTWRPIAARQVWVPLQTRLYCRSVRRVSFPRWPISWNLCFSGIRMPWNPSMGRFTGISLSRSAFRGGLEQHPFVASKSYLLSVACWLTSHRTRRSLSA